MSKLLLSRRLFLSLTGAAATSPLLADGERKKHIQGTVYIDRNGIRGPGMKGVAVSDGRNVVLTDALGRFTLPADHAKARFVSVSIPSGWRTPIHYHPIRSETKDYSFGLTPWAVGKKGQAHRFIQITDTEMSSGPQEHYLKMADELKALAASEKAAFIVHTGDICYEKGLRTHISLINTEKMGVPVFYCLGNHDLVGYGPYGEKLFEEIYGPCWYSFNVAGTHYIVLPMPYGDRSPSFNCDEIAAWMKNDLAVLPKGTPIICFEHDRWTFGDHFDYKGVNLNAHNLKAWVYGHWHYNSVRKQGDVLNITSAPPEKGGIDASASGYRIVNTDTHGKITTDLRYGYNPGSFAANLIQSGICTVSVYKTASRTLRVIANVEGRKIEGKQISAYAWVFSGVHAGDHAKFTAYFQDGSSLDREKTFTKESLLAWQNCAGGEVFMSSPVICNGRIFIGTTDENLRGEGGVTAFDAKTGKRLWKKQMPASVKHSIAAGEGLVFAQDTEGNVCAFRIANGSLAWKDNLGSSPLFSIGGVTLLNGVLYAGTAGWLTAFDAKTGKRLWHGGGWGVGEATPEVPAVDPVTGTIVMGSQWRSLCGNDAKTGKKLWERSDGGLRFRGPLATFEGDHFWITTRDTLYCLKTRTGKTIENIPIPLKNNLLGNGLRPLLAGDLIILTTSKSGIIAVDRKQKKIAWQLATGAGLSYTTPYGHFPDQLIQGSPIQIDEKRCCCAASDGCVYIVEMQTGKCLRKFSFGAPFFGSPLAVDGKFVFVADLGGTVSAIRI